MPVRESAVLAPDGRPILIGLEPPFRGAGTGRRFVGFASGRGIGPNAALLPHLDELRSRSRALYRNNPLIWGAIETLTANLIGWGLTPKSQHPKTRLREKIDNAWRDWAQQIKLDQLQRHAAREALIAGECFARVRQRRRTDTDALGRRLLVPLELQLIEAEHLPTGDNRLLGTGTAHIRAGIEFDGIGRRAAYWFYPQHPGDGLQLATFQEQVAVPAVEVAHLFDPDSPEQIRGVPRLARTLLHAHDLGQFHDATLQRQAISALFAGFIKRPDGSPGMLDETPANPEPILEPGTLSYLADGEDITFPNTPDVGSNYAAFVKAMHLLLAAGTGVTYEQLSGDLSSVNYSSIRAGALEFRRRCEVWQYLTFVPQFLEPIWVAFLRRAALAGVIPDLGADEVAACRVEWMTQGWDWVDPAKEVAALEKSVQAGFSTRRRVNLALGNDPGEIERERKEESDRAKADGLTYSSDAPATSAAAPGADPANVTPDGGAEPAAPGDSGDESTPTNVLQLPRKAQGGTRP